MFLSQGLSYVFLIILLSRSFIDVIPFYYLCLLRSLVFFYGLRTPPVVGQSFGQ